MAAQARKTYIQGHLATGMALYETDMESSWEGLTFKQKGLGKLYMRTRLRYELRSQILAEDMTSELAILATEVTALTLTSIYDDTMTTTIAAFIADINANGLL